MINIERDFVWQLRLGNALMYKGEVCYVYGLCTDNEDESEPYADLSTSNGVAYGIVPHHQRAEDFSPIELTPELLGKIKGWSHEKEDIWGNEYYTTDFVDIKIFLSKSEVYANDGYLPHIKYLHDIQNLYHALTGTELSITL